MAKSSRWSQWVVAESADPRIQMPWTLGERVRKSTRRAQTMLPGAFAPQSASPQPLH